MANLRNEMFKALNMFKGFTCGYISSIRNKMFIDYEGDRYVVTIQKVEKNSDDISKDMNYHLKRNPICLVTLRIDSTDSEWITQKGIRAFSNEKDMFNHIKEVLLYDDRNEELYRLIKEVEDDYDVLDVYENYLHENPSDSYYKFIYAEQNEAN